jgi:hypothetical protein
MMKKLLFGWRTFPRLFIVHLQTTAFLTYHTGLSPQNSTALIFLSPCSHKLWSKYLWPKSIVNEDFPLFQGNHISKFY